MLTAARLRTAHPVLFSITVHESMDCVVDLAKNFARFAPGTGVVFHVNRTAPFTPEELRGELKGVRELGLYINEEQIEVAWSNGTILRAHLSNLKAIEREKIAHSRISFEASNTLFVRDGVMRHISQHDCGYRKAMPAEKFLETLGWEHAALEDKEFEAYIGAPPHIYQIEGSWFPKAMFKPIVQELDEYLSTGGADNYWTEEVYPFMMWERRYPGVVPGAPFTLVLYEPWMLPSTSDVIAIHSSIYKYENFYAIKRVPRQYDHPLRCFIRAVGKY